MHHLLDKCDDDFLLEEAKSFLETATSAKDWWDELTDEDKKLVLESDRQDEKGMFISHSKLVQQFEEWRKKGFGPTWLSVNFSSC